MKGKRMRQVKMVGLIEEHSIIMRLAIMLNLQGFSASNSTLVAVSSDYSSIVWQVLRHHLSHNGEVCDGFTVDVPYPDEVWDWTTERKILRACEPVTYRKNLILIEAGVIRGSNYRNLVGLIKKYNPDQKIVTATMYENYHSAFKSDYVAEYYDDAQSDLTFWWERYNKHWEPKA